MLRVHHKKVAEKNSIMYPEVNFFNEDVFLFINLRLYPMGETHKSCIFSIFQGRINYLKLLDIILCPKGAKACSLGLKSQVNKK